MDELYEKAKTSINKCIELVNKDQGIHKHIHAYRITTKDDINVESMNDSDSESRLDKMFAICYRKFICVKRATVFSIAGIAYSTDHLSHDIAESYYCKSNLSLVSDLYWRKHQNEKGVISFRNVNKYLLEDLIQNTITVAHPSLMNDPMDTQFLLWRDCKRKRDDGQYIDNDLEAIEAYSKSLDYFRIRSFVDNSPGMLENILMWSHYANEHNGIAIVYNFSDDFKCRETNNSSQILTNIDYFDDVQNEDVTKPWLDTENGFLTKSWHWSYENEIRLLSYDTSSSNKISHIPLDEGSKITAVYFGTRCSDSDKKTIMTLLRKRDVKFYQMKINYKDIYHLQIESLV